MTHKDPNNGYVCHRIEERLNVPCGAVQVCTDMEGNEYALVEFNGPNQGQTEVKVLPEDHRPY